MARPWDDENPQAKDLRALPLRKSRGVGGPRTGPGAFAAGLSASGGPPRSRLERVVRPPARSADAERIHGVRDHPFAAPAPTFHHATAPVPAPQCIGHSLVFGEDTVPWLASSFESYAPLFSTSVRRNAVVPARMRAKASIISEPK
jgi:hypothetical protein